VYLGDLLCIYVNLRAFCQFLWTIKLCVGVQYVCEVVEMMCVAVQYVCEVVEMMCVGVQYVCAVVEMMCVGVQYVCAVVEMMCVAVQYVCAVVEMMCVGVQYVCEVVEMMSDKRRVMVLLVAYIKHILVSPRACCLESTALNHHSLN